MQGVWKEMIGKTLGNRYTILEEINGGGMAFVYKAKCTLLNRIVAVKILKPEFSKTKILSEVQERSAGSGKLCPSNIVAFTTLVIKTGFII